MCISLKTYNESLERLGAILHWLGSGEAIDWSSWWGWGDVAVFFLFGRATQKCMIGAAKRHPHRLHK